ncbi:hypothetical protein EIN_375230 [Entamoeba invadens IP1]|uniref:Uncharacterized protein n=1 Tax=Entamoeba invadens IP1 TaxID=370355 RepID=A0A0A1TVY0_ENTIV|nr:hypothetical protein EIN_375230 [Entamoeba invadens IP1]ELP83438.1 hypothetical protein EIN_375230 [Entamoeba invadens IP1]|eukprot:XP_004182784.1 hypothetical protein EIN_375230 [Entamoeba invadens IP1]
MLPIVLFLVVIVVRSEDFFHPYLHSGVMLSRMKMIRYETKKRERKLLKIEKQERKLQNALEVLYNDLKIAVDKRDRLFVESQVVKLQQAITKLRMEKRKQLRLLRRVTDKIASPDRDRIVRSTGVDYRVGVERTSHLERDFEYNQKVLHRYIKKYAHKYATMAAEIATARMRERYRSRKLIKKFHNRRSRRARATRRIYNKVYKKVVDMIEDATAEGVETEKIPMACHDAIEHFARKLRKNYVILVVGTKNAKKVSSELNKHILLKALHKVKKHVKKHLGKIKKVFTKPHKAIQKQTEINAAEKQNQKSLQSIGVHHDH